MKNSSIGSKVIFGSLVCSIVFGLTACSPKSETLTTERVIPEEKVDIPKYDPIPQQEFKWVTEDGGQSQLDFNPRVDILFVVDNSDSMKSAQDNLKRNINQFTSGIVKNRMIDYHIGVTSTWDSSERAVKNKKDPYQIGELRNAKDSTGKIYKDRFLTRKNATPEVLASTIHIGVAPYEQGGPENEEFFSPLMAALEKNGTDAANEGFFREDSQLVVVLMTDADESETRISPEQMARYLVDFKNGQAQKISVYGVLVTKNDADEFKDWNLRVHPKYHPECFDTDSRNRKVRNNRCTSFGPERLEKFILEANSKSGTPDEIQNKFIMKITNKDFGADLARIGSDITVKTLEKTIFLQQRPRYDETKKQFMVRVRYGQPDALAAGRGQIIPQGESGWLYSPEDNSVQLSGKIQYQYSEGARFAVDLVPLTLKQ